MRHGFIDTTRKTCDRFFGVHALASQKPKLLLTVLLP
jgi:hypothetical protein